MATAFMRWLERSPEMYERGIQMLTLGRLGRIRALITGRYVQPGMRILEIGCGTGTLAGMMADRGARVSGVDLSPSMVAYAEGELGSHLGRNQVSLRQMDASTIADHFETGTFDLIVSSLLLSELQEQQLRNVLAGCRQLLSPNGRLLVADEAMPGTAIARLLYRLVRLPLLLLTWLLTRTSTAPLRHFRQTANEAGFETERVASLLAGTLVMFECRPVLAQSVEQAPVAIPLSHQATLKTLLVSAWALLFRIIPPYPKVPPGIYAIGEPGPADPVLVTGNFQLTVQRLLRAVDGRLHAWLLVADSAGINVWCAAGGGFFTADNVIAAVRSSRVERLVEHRVLVLPQLCATGVDGWRIRQEIGWAVHWGPVHARDIPSYIEAKYHKSDAMRWLSFPLHDRLEMVTVTLGFYGLLILLPIFIFWRHLFLPATLALAGLSYTYALLLPWLPGRDGLLKSVPLSALALVGLLGYTQLVGMLPELQLFNWAIALVGLAVFTAAEFQGMSPLMRGEQANWGWEVLIGATLGLAYWLVPLALGWK